MITSMTIHGMTCNGCVKHVDDALRAVAGVTAVEVSLPDQRAKIVHDERSSVDALRAAVEQAGYQVVTGPTPTRGCP